MSVRCTDLAAGVPQGHWVVVGGVCPGACWIDAAQLLHIMTDVGIRCREHIRNEYLVIDWAEPRFEILSSHSRVCVKSYNIQCMSWTFNSVAVSNLDSNSAWSLPHQTPLPVSWPFPPWRTTSRRSSGFVWRPRSRGSGRSYSRSPCLTALLLVSASFFSKH